MSSSSLRSGSNRLALFSVAAGVAAPVALALSWLLTYSPLTLQAYPTLQTIVDGVLDLMSFIGALSAVVVGIIALVRSGHYPRGQGHTGLAIAGVVLGAVELIIFLLALAVLVLVATHP